MPCIVLQFTNTIFSPGDLLMADYLFRGSLEKLDPDIYELTQLEAERQYRKLILIASESSAPVAVREALSSAFQNIYAEGYPDEEDRKSTRLNSSHMSI